MKKTLAIIMLLLFLLSLTAALAEKWTCPQCGKESEGYFCPYCGAQKPEKVVICSDCGAVYSQDMKYTFCQNCGSALSGASLRDLKTGDTLIFGHYDQDGNARNGTEGIEWIVLANDRSRCMMISKYGLDAKPYNTVEVDVTWETCTLRKWLNGDFLKAAFTAEEQAMLETVTVTADENPQSDADPGNDTRDRVFLLSIEELEKYLPSDDERVCLPTDTAVENGICVWDDYIENGIDTCWWWLRTPGNAPNYAADVYHLGCLDLYGALVDNEGSVDGSSCYIGPGAVRPVVVLQS